jgi:RimJ/RimL family protein N-acetyltransferase
MDAPDALAIYGAPEVVSWLAPPVRVVASEARMRSIIRSWSPVDAERGVTGHWAVVAREGSVLVGGASLERAALDDEDLTLSCALEPRAWGRGYAAEAGTALLRWALHEGGVPEVYAIVRRDNARGLATAQRMGMDWVADEDRAVNGGGYVFRLRHGDLALEE